MTDCCHDRDRCVRTWEEKSPHCEHKVGGLLCEELQRFFAVVPVSSDQYDFVNHFASVLVEYLGAGVAADMASLLRSGTERGVEDYGVEDGWVVPGEVETLLGWNDWRGSKVCTRCGFPTSGLFSEGVELCPYCWADAIWAESA
jgi:hypothetical protein